MSLNRYSKKRDGNEPEIVDALRKVGAKVERLDLLDLLVQFRGRIYLIEVKTEKGKNTEAQLKLKQQGWVYHTVKNVEEALKAIGAV